MEPANGKTALERLAADKLAADQAALPGGTVPAPPPVPSGPPKIDRLDQLEAEAIYKDLVILKGQGDVIDAQKVTLEAQSRLIELQKVTLEGQKKDIGLQMLKLQEQMKAKRDEMSAKYGIPMDQGTQVKADGTIVPKPLPRAVTVPPHMVQGKLPDGTPISVPADAIAGGNTAIKAP
jgi:hypothetical protein